MCTHVQHNDCSAFFCGHRWCNYTWEFQVWMGSLTCTLLYDWHKHCALNYYLNNAGSSVAMLVSGSDMGYDTYQLAVNQLVLRRYYWQTGLAISDQISCVRRDGSSWHEEIPDNWRKMLPTIDLILCACALVGEEDCQFINTASHSNDG